MMTTKTYMNLRKILTNGEPKIEVLETEAPEQPANIIDFPIAEFAVVESDYTNKVLAF